MARATQIIVRVATLHEPSSCLDPAQTFEQVLCVPVLLPPANASRGPALPPVSKGQVLRDGQLREDRQLLVHEPQAE
jgi:hypothetical protein